MQVVVGPSYRHASRRDVPDVAVDVGVHDVLLRRSEIAQRRDEFLPVACERQPRHCLDGKIVLRKRGPGKREHVAARRCFARGQQHVGDDRAVARTAHDDEHVFAALTLMCSSRSRTAARRRASRSCRRCRAYRGRVLHVRTGVGESPRDAPAFLPAPPSAPRKTSRRSFPRPGASRCANTTLPARWSRRCGVVGEERLAALGAAAGDHPVVRAERPARWQRERWRHAPQVFGPSCTALFFQVAVERSQLGSGPAGRPGRVAGIPASARSPGLRKASRSNSLRQLPERSQDIIFSQASPRACSHG